MKKFVVPIIMGAFLLIGSLVMVSFTPPYNAKQCKTDCEFLVSVGYFSSNGKCQSACATCTNPSESEATGAACLCKIIDDTEGLEETYGINMGECINLVKP